MKNVFSFISISIVIAMSACKSSESTSSHSSSEVSSKAEKPQLAPSLLASIERTACYGQCPMYKATFMDNGEVIYVGKRFVENLGTYRFLLEESEVKEIKKKILEYDYFSLDSLYPTPISDFPSCLTEVRLNGRNKKVIDRRNPPDNLKSFEKFLDSLLLDRTFEKVSDDTNYDLR